MMTVGGATGRRRFTVFRLRGFMGHVILIQGSPNAARVKAQPSRGRV